jgi:Protein of unknown function (DUF2786)
MSTNAADRRADLLRRIRALIAQAEDRAVTPEEADAFRTKADELMTKYAVEEFELLMADRSRTHSPEVREVSFMWYWSMEDDRDVRGDLWWMFQEVYSHARCVVLNTMVSSRAIKVAGYPGDLDYADMLFTSLFLQLVGAVDPEPEADLSYEENLERFKRAGIDWYETARRMNKAGMLPRPFDPEKSYAHCAHDYRRWVRRTGREQNYNHHKTYRRNFSEAFAARIATRLRALRTEQDAMTSESGSQYALVLRDVRATVQEFVYNEFPSLRPHKRDCDCSECVERRKRKPTIYKDNRKVDYEARREGYEAGARADIAGHPHRRVEGAPQELEG